jgi:DNA-binding transcriptional ArsR family regulator
MPATSVSDDAVFSALADANRRRLLTLVGERGTATATELAGEVPISRQAIQKHLAGLSAAGLVAPERSGREVRYRMTPAPLSGAMAWMATVGGQWDDRLAALQRSVERSDRT